MGESSTYPDNIIYNYNISTGIKKEILQSSVFFNPIPVKNENIIYLLKNINDDPSDPLPSCEVYRYDLANKSFSKIALPNIKNFDITTDFTISPNEKVIIFNNIFDGNRYMYVIDKETLKIIDKVETPQEAAPEFAYSWKSDSSYVIFTMDYKEIYKYTIPKY